MKPAIDDMCVTRSMIDGFDVRAINVENRSATFVAATENGVLTYAGREHLRIAGVNLQRYRRNPVVLDSHNRSTVTTIVGRCTVSIDEEQRQLVAEIQFAKTPRAEEVWTLVRDGFIRALSVGFIPDDATTLELSEGETLGEGARQIVGPARVIRQWELYEISVVPVPADAEAVRRAQESARQKEGEMAKAQTEPGPAPAPQPEPAVVSAPSAPENIPAIIGELDAERALRDETARVQHIRLIAPAELAALAQECITTGLSVEESRRRLLEENARRLKPVGTPEPVTAAPPPPQQISQASNEELAASIRGR